MKITHVYGYPIATFEPFTRHEIDDIRHKIKSDELAPLLQSVGWNANCLTTSTHGQGDDREDDVRQCFAEKGTLIMQTVHACLKEFLDAIGIRDMQPSMHKCGKLACGDDKCSPDCWINVYREGHFQETHWHHGEDVRCVFGFVYFVQYDKERDGKFTFVNPAPDLKVPGLDACEAFRREFVPDVNEGTILIFPSFMLHNVSVQTSGERITIAGNFFVRVS